MVRAGGRNRLGVEWIARGRRCDYRLSAASPVFTHVHHHPAPTSLQVDLHAGMEVGLVTEGEEERLIEEATITVRAGDVWLCAMWEPHAWRVTKPDTWEILLIFLPEFLGEEMLGDHSWLALFSVPPAQRPRVCDPEARAAVLAIGHELRAEIEEQKQGWLSAARLCLLRLLLVLSRQWDPHRRAGSSRATHPGILSRLMPALDLLHVSPARRVLVREAAAACGLGRSQFDRLFRQAMGMSFGRFSVRARLASVARELLLTDRPTETVASDAGFVDASHLHRCFVKHYGCTPAAYRRQFGRRSLPGLAREESTSET